MDGDTPNRTARILDYENMRIDDRVFRDVVDSSRADGGRKIIFIVDTENKSYIYGEVASKGNGYFSHAFGSGWTRSLHGSNLWGNSERGRFIENFAFIEAVINQILTLLMCNYTEQTAREAFYEYLERTDLLNRMMVLRKQKIISIKLGQDIETLGKIRNKLAHRLTREPMKIGASPREEIQNLTVQEINELVEKVADELAKRYANMQAPYISWILGGNSQ